MLSSRIGTVFAALAIAFSAFAFAAPRAGADDLRLTLDQLTVERARERSGDRPYIASIVFRSRHNTRGSTSVRVQEREPHDWVSKPRWNRRGSFRGHILSGRTVDLPRWMGRHEWRTVNIPRVSADRRTWAAATRSEVLGAIIVTLDNNNTPPHVIRGVLQRIAGRVRDLLVRQIEGGVMMRRILNRWLRGDRSTRVDFDASSLTTGLFSDMEIFDLGLGLTSGSTHNPDRIAGVQVVIVPALDGAGPFAAEPDRSFTLPGSGPITVRTLAAEPNNRSVNFVFDSSGARYRVRGRLERVRAVRPTAERISALQFVVRTGGDNLRSGGNAVLRVFARDGSMVGTASINRGAELRNNTARTVVVTLRHRGRAGIARDQLSHFEIRLAQGMGVNPDNWNMDRVTVHARLGRRLVQIFDRAGHPLFRFTKDRPFLRLRPFASL